MNRQGLLAKVHIAKKDLGLDDDAYREVLYGITGERSAGRCSDQQLVAVVERLRARGWQPRAGGKQSDNPQARMIFAIWGELGRIGALHTPTRPGLRAYCNNLVGVEDPEWLSPEQAAKVIESLKHWQKRAKLERAKACE